MPAKLDRMWGTSSPTLPTRREIVDLSVEVRASLQLAWCCDTAHHSVDYAAARTPSTGQCYVSSMAFVWALRKGWPDVTARIVRGHMSHHGVPLIADHGWVEVGVGPRRLLIDLTADQAVDGLKVVAIAAQDLGALGYDYRALDSRTLGEVKNEDVWTRFFILHSFMQEGAKEVSARSFLGA